jgi:hypothetical protein
MQSNAETVAGWYFRLNGFLTTLNFVVHPDLGSVQRTDVDVLGVRLPHRNETAGGRSLLDDRLFEFGDGKTLLIIAEVKDDGPCRLNGPATDPGRADLQKVLSAIGAFENDEVAKAAAGLYESGSYKNSAYRAHLIALAGERNLNLTAERPDVLQITWLDVADFIYRRFGTQKDPKKQHQQWDSIGKQLWTSAQTSSIEQFREKLKELALGNGPIKGMHPTVQNPGRGLCPSR